MILRALRIVLCLGVLAGVLLPKTSVALVQLGLIRGQVLVICTGRGLETVVLDRDGRPVGISHADHPCLLTHAADTATAVLLPPITVGFAMLGPLPHAADHPPAMRRPHDACPRAPPVV